MRNKVLALVLLSVFLASPLWAKEQALTNQERGKSSDAVVTGVVDSIEEVAALTEEEKLFSAKIKVDKLVKPHKMADGRQMVQVYFLNGAENPDMAAEHHVDLKVGEKADFYLDVRPLFENKNVFFIKEQSDIQKPNSFGKKT